MCGTRKMTVYVVSSVSGSHYYPKVSFGNFLDPSLKVRFSCHSNTKWRKASFILNRHSINIQWYVQRCATQLNGTKVVSYSNKQYHAPFHKQSPTFDWHICTHCMTLRRIFPKDILQPYDLPPTDTVYQSYNQQTRLCVISRCSWRPVVIFQHGKIITHQSVWRPDTEYDRGQRTEDRGQKRALSFDVVFFCPPPPPPFSWGNS